MATIPPVLAPPFGRDGSSPFFTILTSQVVGRRKTETRLMRLAQEISGTTLSAFLRRLQLTGKGQPFNQLLVLVSAACLVALVAVVAALLTIDNRTAGADMLRGQRVANDVARLMILVQRAETSQRGYLLTANAEYLHLYDDSITKIGPLLETLTEATKEDLIQGREVLNLRALVGAKLAELARVLTLFDSGKRAEALAVVRTNAGKSLMDQVRASIAALWNEAGRQTEIRIDAWYRNSNWLFAVQVGAALLVLLVSTLAVLSGIRHTRGLQETQQTLQQTNEFLEERVNARTADLQEANDEIQKFAYIISHDLRSPLVNIMGFASELAAIRAETAHLLGLKIEAAPPDAEHPRPIEAIDRDFGEALAFIQQSTTKMDRLISAVLKLARSGQRQFRFERLDMNALVSEIADTLKHRTTETGSEIVIDPLPDMVGDRLAIEQIFGNLLDNAVKYLEESRLGRIEIRGRSLPRGVIYEIEDNGRGIAAEDKSRVFDLFRRGGKQDRPGEGIGLAHLKVLIRRLGGKISCRSELGRGSVFSVFLPQSDLRGHEMNGPFVERRKGANT
jgi:signal transduction histidine kinase